LPCLGGQITLAAATRTAVVPAKAWLAPTAAALPLSRDGEMEPNPSSPYSFTNTHFAIVRGSGFAS